MDLKILEIQKEKEYVLFRAERDQNLWPYILFDATFDRKQSLWAVLRTLIKIYTFAPNFKFGTK